MQEFTGENLLARIYWREFTGENLSSFGGQNLLANGPTSSVVAFLAAVGLVGEPHLPANHFVCICESRVTLA